MIFAAAEESACPPKSISTALFMRLSPNSEGLIVSCSLPSASKPHSPKTLKNHAMPQQPEISYPEPGQRMREPRSSQRNQPCYIIRVASEAATDMSSWWACQLHQRILPPTRSPSNHRRVTRKNSGVTWRSTVIRSRSILQVPQAHKPGYNYDRSPTRAGWQAKGTPSLQKLGELSLQFLDLHDNHANVCHNC